MRLPLLLLLPALLFPAQQSDPLILANDYMIPARYEEGVRKMRDILAQSPPPETAARAWQALGNLYQRQAKFDLALDAFTQRLRIHQAAGDARNAAAAWQQIARAHNFRNDPTQRRAAIEQSVALARQTADPALLQLVLRDLGELTKDAGNYEQAIRHFEEALTFSDQARKLAPSSTVTANYIAILTSLTDCHRYLDDLDNADATLTTAFRVSEQAKAPLGLPYTLRGLIALQRGRLAEALASLELGANDYEQRHNPAFADRIRSQMGDVHLQLGNPDLALRLLDPILARQLTIGFEQDIAQTRRKIALVHISLRNYAAAAAHLEQALAIFRRRQNPEQAFAVQVRLAEVYAQQGAARQAADLATSLLPQLQANTNQTNRISALHALATAHDTLQDLPAALTAAAEAAALATELDYPDMIRPALTHYGQLLRRANRLPDAETAFRQAIAANERLRENTGDPAANINLLATTLTPYHALADLLFSQRRHADALHISELTKGRTLRDIMASGPSPLQSFLSPVEKDQLRRARARLSQLNRSAAAPDRLKAARLDLEALETSLRAAHPQLKLREAELAPFQLPTFRHRALEFLITADAIYWFALNGASLRAGKLLISRATLERKVTAFRQLLAARDPAFRQPARELYNLLLAPAAFSSGPLILIPDSFLWGLPFQALLIDNQYAADRFTLSYAPSLSTLPLMRRRGLQLSASSSHPPLLVSHDSIPGSAAAVRQLAALLPNNPTLFSGTENQFKSLAPRHGLLHFYTHGFLDAKKPLYSRLLLASPAADQDGLLEAWEVAELQLSARLAVLAACESGAGSATAGEGLLGFSWALLAAGTPASIVSQWKVDSASTATLFQHFYSTLPKQPRFTAALQAAAAQLRQNPAFAHPFYWAPFVLIGDPQ